jgi:plastocyanin
MLLSKAEASGFFIGLCIIGAMAFVVFHGPFNRVNRAHASPFRTVQAKIVSDPNTVGRYAPAKITLHVGQAVTFTNVSDADHTVTDPNLAFDSGTIGTNGTHWTFTATFAGVYHFRCSFHPQMLGTLTVTK